MSLFKRTREKIHNKRKRILSGKVNCIPWGLPRFENESPGIEQGKYYMITANTKVGKTQITDFLFLYNTVKQIIDNGLNIRLKIFYFTLEISDEDKMLSAFSNILFIKEGIIVTPTQLKSTKAESPLSQEILDIIDSYEPYFNKIEEIVEFIDSTRNAFGIYNIMRSYAKDNGTQYKKTINTGKEIFEVDDYYQPNDSDEYVFCIIDHISLITPEKGSNLRDSIIKLSSHYLLRLRNKYNYIPIVVQQQAAAGESIEHAKAGKLKPTLENLGDCKITARDANLILGLFSPFRHDIPNYLGYDIKYFKDNIRFLEILGGRDGGAGIVCPLFFNGAVNHFKELPLSRDEKNIKEVYKYIKKIRK